MILADVDSLLKASARTPEREDAREFVRTAPNKTKARTEVRAFCIGEPDRVFTQYRFSEEA
jgi:hypothetical protein